MRPPGRIMMLLKSGFSLARTELLQESQAMAPCTLSPEKPCYSDPPILLRFLGGGVGLGEDIDCWLEDA